MTAPAAKARLRAEAKRRLNDPAWEAKALVPDRWLCTFEPFRNARTVLLYMRLAGEPETILAADNVLESGRRLVLPRVTPASAGAMPGTLTLHQVYRHEDTRAGSFGIREPDPARCPEVDPAEVDFAGIPGLGFDRTGTRLGRGGGYYDRLLARLRPEAFRCGLFFACQEFEKLPRDPHDIPLHAVVTERELIECS